MKRNWMKKLVCLGLSIVLLLGNLPVGAFAEDAETLPEETAAEVTEATEATDATEVTETSEPETTEAETTATEPEETGATESTKAADEVERIEEIERSEVVNEVPSDSTDGRLQQLPEDICCNTNIWTLLTPVKEYYTATGWGNSSKGAYSVTFPVVAGDQIYATSFLAAGENGFPEDGVRITWFSETEVLESQHRNDVYAEFTANGYITVPKGAVAVNIPMIDNADTWEIYIRTREHCFGDWYETKEATYEADGEKRRDCVSCDACETCAIPCLEAPQYPWDTDGDGALEILAIGNSFSVDALEYTYQIAQDLGIQEIVLGNLYIGGCTLETHAANAAGDLGKYTYYFNDNGKWSSTGSYKISTALESRSWDYVSMQQGSPVSGVESSYNEDLTDLITYVKERSDAKLVWHMTWAYQQDSTHSAFPTYGKNQMTMYNAIVSAVQNKIVTNDDFDLIVPNGTAVQNSRTSLLGDTTTRDGYHMSYDYGRYLTGLLFIKTVTGLSVDNITYAPSGVDAQEAAIAIESVNNAFAKPFAVTESAYVVEEPEIPDEGYILLQSELYKGAFWHPLKAGYYNELIYNQSNSNQFFATIRFTRESLPVGSIIILADGWQYRPDGWVTDTLQTGTREPVTTEPSVVITEEWWGNYTIRSFNISKVGLPSLANVSEEEVRAAFQIYVPEAKHTHKYEAGTCALCGEAAPSLEGRTISILGASISTYQDTSNGAAANTTNSTIANNVKYYPNTTIPEVTLNDTWWMQAASDLGLRLLVNNSWSGSSLLYERNGTVGAYVDRCVQLHDDTGDNAGEVPDIIAIQMGTNDFQYYKDTLGTADIDYDALIVDNGDGTYTYSTPVTSLEAAAIVLHKISVRYPGAEVYYLNISQRVDGTDELIRSFNAELKQVVEHFDACIVDIYGSAITMADFETYIGDGRVHPNKLGMDAYTEAFKQALVANTAYPVLAHTVRFDLDGVTADYGDDKIVVNGDAFTVKLTGSESMEVTVSMGGKDITAAAYADGTVSISAVTGDVTITAKSVHTPEDYRWAFDGTNLTCVEGENSLTKNAGTTTNGIFSKTRYTLEKAVVLSHDQPWVVEWKCQGTFLNTNGSSGARIFTSDDVNANYNARYIFKSNTNGIIAMGEKDTKGSHNYGIALADHGIDWTQLHTYRLENRIADDGSNMVYLFVDGAQIGPMNHYYVGTTDKKTTSDWLSGKDFLFPYMGTDTHGFTNCSIEYIAVWEDGHTHTYESVVTAPTCTEQGYTTYTCACGDSYIDSYVDAEEHDYGAWEEEDTDTRMRTCAACDAEDRIYRLTLPTSYSGLVYVENNPSGFHAGTRNVAAVLGLKSGTFTNGEVAVNIDGTHITVSGTPTKNLYFDLQTGEFGTPNYTRDVGYSLPDGDYRFGINGSGTQAPTVCIRYPDGSGNLMTASQSTGVRAVPDVNGGDFGVPYLYFPKNVAYDYSGNLVLTMGSNAVYDNQISQVDTIGGTGAFTVDGYLWTTEDTVAVFGYPVSPGEKENQLVHVPGNKEFIQIYLPQEEGYLQIRMNLANSTSTNAYGWRLDMMYACDDNYDEIFPITQSGEYEAAIKLKGRPDFMGMGAHGSERMTSFAVYVDGEEITLGQMTELTSWETIKMVRYSDFYDPADETTVVAHHIVEYHFDQSGLTVDQSVEWLVDETCAISYMMMFPVRRTYENLQITDTYFDNFDSAEYDVSQASFKTYPVNWTPGATKMTLSSKKSGVTASMESLYTSQLTGTGYKRCSNSSSYNKLYFTICGGGSTEQTVNQGDVWSTQTRYEVTIQKGTDVDKNCIFGHKYSSTVTPATCEENGYTTHTCSACGDSYVDSYVDALDHTEVIDAKVEPTCTTTGLTEGKHCDLCGKVLITQSILSAKGHDYEGTACTACGETHPNAVNYQGKVISIMGDSISTFAGYIPVADGFNLEHLARYPQDNLLTDVNETWWMQVVNGLEAKLGINDSWRGATVSGAAPVTSGTTGENAAMSNLQRIKNLGANGYPDVILFYGGTNDLAHVSKVGSFDPDTAPEKVDLTTAKWDNLADGYVHTLLRLKHYYPDSQIIAMLPTYTASYYSNDKLAQGNAVLAAICEHYGVNYVDLRDCGISVNELPDGIHPDAAGMDYITDAVVKALLTECEMTPGENVVHSVTHNLTGAESALGYYKGVSHGKAFVAAITGEDLQVTVTMGGADVTASVYTEGMVNIPSVTGDIVITAEGRIKPIYEDHLQQLPDPYHGVDLWKVLEHDKEYFYVDKWMVHASGNVYSVTVPVVPGEKIWASSFSASGTNGASMNGIRITWFDADGLLKSVEADKVYKEFTENGYLTVPENAAAVNIPMWTNASNWELYIWPSDYEPGFSLDDHLQQLPEKFCASTNLWTELVPENEYYTVTGWGNLANGRAWSITIPVISGERIYANSFKKYGENGNTSSANNGIRVTWFDENGVLKAMSADETYKEFTQNGGWLVAPDGATAVNIPMWTQSDSNEVYLLDRAHDYAAKITDPTCTEQGYTTHTCTICGGSYIDSYVDALGHTEVIDAKVEPTCTATGLTEGKHCDLCGKVLITQSILSAKGHDYEGTACTACGETHPNAANYQGKVISILGDSISTFAGYIPVADGFNLQHYARYPQDNLLTDVNETWWMQVLNDLDAKLGINESWRSTEVGNIYDVEVNSGYEGTKACMASMTRIQNLGSNGTPDVILFYGGTNDITQRRTVGSFEPTTAPTQVDLTSVKWDTVADAYVTAIMRLQHYYPDAEIIAMLPTYTSKNTDAVIEKYNSLFGAICKHYGVTYIDLRECGISTSDLPDGTHPDAAGMDYITNAVLDTLLSECEMVPGEHVVHSVKHELTDVTASLGYYKGVSHGEAFAETLSADDGMDVIVTMGGVDITASCYADGMIAISSVTGDIEITAEAKFSLGEHLQQLPEKFCAETNLWSALEPENEYYTATGWGNLSDGRAWSVTIPVVAGERIYATSFEKYGANGNASSSSNGIRVTYFNEDGVQRAMKPADTYAEFVANGGWLVAPDGATAVNIPMWTQSDSNEVYLLDRAHDYASKVTDPTCTEQGYTTHTCSICGDSFVDSYVDATGHSYGQWQEVTAPTADSLGVQQRVCACGETETQEVEGAWQMYALADHLLELPENVCCDTNLWALLPHEDVHFTSGKRWGTNSTPVTSITIPLNPGDRVYATSWNKAGENGHETLNGIRLTFFSAYGIAQTLGPGESYSKFAANGGYLVAPEGTIAINIAMWYDSEDYEVYILNREHIYEEVTVAPSCNEPGYSGTICLGCGDGETHSYIDALGHSLTAHEAKNPTCLDIGWEAYETCSRCEHSTYTEIPAQGHSFGEWEQITAPTCDAEGQDKSVCTNCGETVYRDTRISGDSGKILVSNPVPEGHYEGKRILAIGDSLTAGTGVTAEQRYHALLAQRLNATNINGGTSGATLCPGGHLPNKFDTLMTANYLTKNKIDVVTIFLGINDWDNGVVNGTYQGKPKYDESLTYYDLGEFGTEDTTTIYGAAKMWCERILELKATAGCEDIQFVFATSVITSWNKSVTTARDWNQDKVNVFGYTLRQYCTAIMEVCAYYEIPVLDLNMYSGMYYHSETDNNVDYFGGDGIHPGANGHAMMADAFEEFLLEGYTYESRSVSDCGHDFKETVTEPTCTEGGFSTYRCPECHYSYVDSYTDAKDHSYGQWYVYKEATATEDGEDRRNCENCDHGQYRIVVPVQLSAAVEPPRVTVGAKPEDVKIGVSASKGSDGSELTDVEIGFVITDADGNEVTMEEALKKAGSYTITPIIVSKEDN